jgi:hypothetical protein
MKQCMYVKVYLSLLVCVPFVLCINPIGVVAGVLRQKLPLPIRLN